MKKIVPAFFVICLMISCTKSIYSSSDWQNRKVTVDGRISEWPYPLRFYDADARISYTISNDHQNLYLCCSISDESMQTKILRSGLEFGIDTLGKKSFPISIKYPFGNAAVSEPKRNTSPQTGAGSNPKMDRSAFKHQLIAEAKEIQLVGFKPPMGRIISSSDQAANGISVAINIDEKGFMVYEAVIPFSTFYKNKLTPSDSNKIFNYRIKINAIQGGNSGGGSRGGGMGGGGMRGGMGGGGMRGGGMGGGGMRGGGMRGGGMNSGEMNGRGMYGGNLGNSSQRNSTTSGLTKTTIKLKLAYK